MMSEIVKVQIPLASNDHQPLPLVYAKGKRLMVMQELSRSAKKAMGEDVKAFFLAKWDRAHSQWVIGNRVKDRDW